MRVIMLYAAFMVLDSQRAVNHLRLQKTVSFFGSQGISKHVEGFAGFKFGMLARVCF